MNQTLIIFVKAPLMGKAKTRLAADIGYVHAQRIYKSMTAQILRNVTNSKWQTILAVTPPRYLARLPMWGGFAQYPQVSGSLSPRLAQAFSGTGKTIIIGSDCPQVKARDIDTAFKAIRPSRAVIGPADDGGFWLIGAMGPLRPSVFENIRWSTQHTLADMEKNLPQKPSYLQTLTDVDDLKALKTVRKNNHLF